MGSGIAPVFTLIVRSSNHRIMQNYYGTDRDLSGSKSFFYFLTDTGAMAVGLCQTRLDGACSIFDDNGKLIRSLIAMVFQ